MGPGLGVEREGRFHFLASFMATALHSQHRGRRGSCHGLSKHLKQMVKYFHFTMGSILFYY